jgi:hypothetical protein
VSVSPAHLFSRARVSPLGAFTVFLLTARTTGTDIASASAFTIRVSTAITAFFASASTASVIFGTARTASTTTPTVTVLITILIAITASARSAIVRCTSVVDQITTTIRSVAWLALIFSGRPGRRTRRPRI